MDIVYDVPDSVEELFSAGEKSYRIIDPDQPGDNVFAMRLFLDVVGVPGSMIVEDEGTQVLLRNGGVAVVIDSGGLGDFHSHGFDVSLLEEDAA